VAELIAGGGGGFEEVFDDRRVLLQFGDCGGPGCGILGFEFFGLAEVDSEVGGTGTSDAGGV
jgi:hypothetical protein